MAVYGDYDVDGITAACLLTDYLRGRGLRCDLYIPDRLTEGYGLNAGAIRRLRDRGVTLLVTVDCGVTNLEEAGLRRVPGYGSDCDGPPRMPGDSSGRGGGSGSEAPRRGSGGQLLAGVGVAFKLVWRHGRGRRADAGPVRGLGSGWHCGGCDAPGGREPLYHPLWAAEDGGRDMPGRGLRLCWRRRGQRTSAPLPPPSAFPWPPGSMPPGGWGRRKRRWSCL